MKVMNLKVKKKSRSFCLYIRFVRKDLGHSTDCRVREQYPFHFAGYFVNTWSFLSFSGLVIYFEKKCDSSIVEVYSCNLNTNLSLCFVPFTVVDCIHIGLQCHSVGNRNLFCVTRSLRSVVW